MAVVNRHVHIEIYNLLTLVSSTKRADLLIVNTSGFLLLSDLTYSENIILKAFSIQAKFSCEYFGLYTFGINVFTELIFDGDDKMILFIRTEIELENRLITDVTNVF